MGLGMRQRARKHVLGLGASVAAVAALALTATFTLGGFSATVANNANTFSSATVQLEENQGATTCFSTGTGSGGSVTSGNSSNCGINLFTGTLDQVPGATALSANITITDVG